MAITRAQIRQRLGVELREGFRSSTATSGSTVHTLVDTAAPYQSSRMGGAYNNFRDWWIFRPAATTTDDQIRRVLSYDPPSGTFLPDKQYAVSPVGEAYELWNCGLTLDEVHDCINQALRRIRARDLFWLVPPVDSQQSSFNRLALPSDVQGWLTNPGWVLSLGSLPEGPRNTAGLSVSIPLAKDYAGVVATFKRDRSKGQIRRVQYATAQDDGGLGTIDLAGARVTVGNLLVLAITVSGSSVTFATGTNPTGWCLAGSAVQGSVRTYLYYRFPTSNGTGITTFSVPYSGGYGVGTLMEYQGLLPGGVDQVGTATGNSATLASGTTSAVSEGDELWVGAIGTSHDGRQFAPTNRFSPVSMVSAANQPASHGVYQRIVPITDLQDRSPSPVQAAQVDPVQEDQDGVWLYPASRISPPSFYVVDTQRPLYSYARADSSGEFGSKGDGLTAEANQVNGDATDSLLDAIVSAAILYAAENYPNFLPLEPGERERRITRASQRFDKFNRSRAPLPRHEIPYLEPVG